MKLAILFCVFLAFIAGTQANETITLYKHRPANLQVGPEDAIYCQITDPKSHIVFDGFGRCNLTIERVSSEHQGVWTMSVGLPDRILLVEQRLTITVKDEEDRPVITTSVVKERPQVVITCTLTSSSPITTCKFRDPNGRILIASPGIGEDRFVYHGSSIEPENGPHTLECGLRITDPLTSDLGLWRCAMESGDETYYGFLAVLCPWQLQFPDIQAMVTTEPTLTAERTAIAAQEGDSVTMSCYIQAPIRYCYFRRQNGTTFSVSPETSTATMEYVGAGFEAGECGVRFHNLLATDAGTWSCAVGLHNNTVVEQRVSFSVAIDPLMRVSQFYDDADRITVDATVNAAGSLDYCRFVRMDGLGFTSQNVPEGYTFTGSLASKICRLLIHEPTILNKHPWTVAAKIVGRDEEIVRATTENLLWFEPDHIIDGYYSGWLLWLFIGLIILFVILAGIACGPKKNREWTFSRATVLRNSLRNSMRKEPLPPQAPITPNYPTQNQQQNA